MKDTFYYSSGPISKVSWGEFVVNNETHRKDTSSKIIGAGKDIIIADGKVIPWTERVGHTLTIDMLKRVVEFKPETLVIGNGHSGAISVPESVLQILKNNGIKKIVVARTPVACELFNILYTQETNVVFVGHGTC
jgi:hypothetical protein